MHGRSQDEAWLMRDSAGRRVLACACLIGVAVPLLASGQVSAADAVTRPPVSGTSHPRAESSEIVRLHCDLHLAAQQHLT